jgi:GGDEF domain-containing protein
MVRAVAGATIDDVGVGASAGTLSCRRRPLPTAAADRAMYAAKQAGGGRVVAIDQADPEAGHPSALANPAT